MNDFNRYETNQSIRRTLLKHAVNLTQVQYTSAGTTAYLFGTLGRDPNGDLEPHQVKALVRELARIPSVREIRFELTNWMVDIEPGMMRVHKR